jgi:ribosomal protein S18 acetylase RimI-like enzyme
MERCWKILRKRDQSGADAVFKEKEPLYAVACGRYLDASRSRDRLWTLRGRQGAVSGLLIFSKQTLFPVFNRDTFIPLPRFLGRLVRNVPLHAIQGLTEEVQILEGAFSALGINPMDIKDYDLMALDQAPEAAALRSGPETLILRRPGITDTDDLYILQSGYEKEEVLPKGSIFNPAACRLNLQRILAEEEVLAAELNGRIVGKINTSARTFTRRLVGGVYVHPEYRGLGIGRRMAAEFVFSILAGGKGASLFVKKQNPAARTVYSRIGFRKLADYRISYY